MITALLLFFKAVLTLIASILFNNNIELVAKSRRTNYKYLRKPGILVLMILGLIENTRATLAPTAIPTKLPTLVPSQTPTIVPTTGPTLIPSRTPTVVPTAPTLIPSRSPTAVPTTTGPTLIPSRTPTVVPTAPTLIPSRSPTAVPTTTGPTLIPSRTPTVVPTAPTLIPTTTKPTTISPTVKPTTTAPTVLPSEAPSYSPVAAPVTYTISTYVGISGSQGNSGDNGPAVNALLQTPAQVWVNTADVLYIADTVGIGVRKVSSTGIITTFAGGGFDSSDGIAATSSYVASPYGVWGDSAGNVYISQASMASGMTLRKVSSTTSIISTIAGYYSLGEVDDIGDGGPASAAYFYSIGTLAVDTSGNVYALDLSCSTIRIIDRTSTIYCYVGTKGAESTFGDGGAASSAGLAAPQSAFVDSTGNMFIASQTGYCIRKVDSSTLIISTYYGMNSYYGFNGDGLPATSTQLGSVMGVFADASGNLFVTDPDQFRVRMVTATSMLSYTIAGPGLYFSTFGDGGYATAASFQYLQFIVGNSGGNSIYLSDQDTIVRKLTNVSPTVSPSVVPSVTPSSPPVFAPVGYTIQTFIGTGSQGSSGDGGPAASASINSPCKLWVNAVGVAYLADFGNNKLRSVSSSGIINTAVGNGDGSSSGNGVSVTSASLYNPAGVWQSITGEVYISEATGQRIRYVSASIIYFKAGTGVASTTSTANNGDGSPATQATLNTPMDIFMNSVGMLYIADSYNHRIRSVYNNIMYTTAGNGIAGSSVNSRAASSTSINTPAGLFIDSTGAGYFSEASGHVIRYVSTASIVSGLVGNFNSGFNGDGQAGTSTIINMPRGLWGDTQGRLFFTDYLMPTVRMLSGGIVYTIAGVSSSSITRASGDGGAATSATFVSLAYVTGDYLGYLYISDFGANTIRKLTSFNPTAAPTVVPTTTPTVVPTYVSIGSPTAYSIAAFAGLNGYPAYSGDSGKATSAAFNNPYGVWQNTVGDAYIADFLNFRVRKVSSTGIVSLVTGTGATSSSGDGGPATSASIYRPISVWADSLVGNLYVAELDSMKVRIITNGIIATFAGNGGFSVTNTDPNGEGGKATSATVRGVYCIYGDSVGQLFMADYSYNKIRKVKSDGILVLVAGTGVASSNGDSGQATSAAVNVPLSVFVNTNGDVYFAEEHGKIRKVAIYDSSISTFAGMSAIGFNGDGMKATSTLLNYVYGVYGDTSGYLYFCDMYNHKVRVITPANTVYTAAGSGASGSSGNGGMATSAYLNFPVFLHGDTVGNILVADYSQNVVRKLFNLSPTLLPSCIPTTRPTIVPSSGPTVVPTSAFPTLVPILVSPTLIPTSQVPTVVPTSVMPSTMPVMPPSFYYMSTYSGVANFLGTAGDGGPVGSAYLNSPHGIWKDSANVYYLTDYSNNRVRSVNSGIINTYAGTGSAVSSGDGNPASSTGLYFPSSVWGNSLGTVYVTERNGCKVRAITTSGLVSTYAGNGYSGTSGDNGQATSAMISYPFGLHGDSSGNLYIADSGNIRARKVSSTGIISTLAGTGSATSGADGGVASSTAISNIRTVFVDTVGNLYLSETTKVRSIAAGSAVLSTLAGVSSFGFNGDGLSATSTALNSPWGLYGDSAGVLWVVDLNNNRVRYITSGTNIVYTAAGNGVSLSSGDSGPGTSASFLQACYVYTIPGGDILVSDCNAHVVRKMSLLSPSVAPSNKPSVVPTRNPTSVMPTVLSGVAPSIYTISTVAGATGTLGYGGDGGSVTNAKISYPYGIWKDSTSMYYFADYGNNRIRSIYNGLINTFCGNGVSASAGDEGPATSANLNSPVDVWGDSLGSMYVLERGVSKVRLVSTAGIISTYVGTGNNGFAGDAGPASIAKINYPFGLYGDSTGNLFIADYGNYRLRKVSSSAIITTIAGIGSSGSSTDGTSASSAAFGSSRDVYVDTIGSIYLSDASKIRNIPSGSALLYTYAGISSTGFNGDGQAATAAAIDTPWGVFGDTVGNLWFGDSKNYRARMVTAGSNIVFTLAGTSVIGTSGDGGYASAASFSQPLYVYPDVSGNVFVTDPADSVIRMLTLLTPTMSPSFTPKPSVSPSASPTPAPVVPLPYGIFGYVGTMAASSTGDGGPGSSASINNPFQVWVNSLGKVYVCDFTSFKVRKVSTTGIISLFAGLGTWGTSGDGGPATSAQLFNPSGVWGSSLGVVYICEYSGAVVRSVDTAGIISTVAGSGSTSASGSAANGDGGPATSATFHSVVSLFVDSRGNVYITDSNNHKIRKVSTSGIISTVVGNGATDGLGNLGPATSASLSYPFGVYGDSVATFYVMEYGSKKLRQVVSSTSIISVKAGVGSGAYTGEGIAATSIYLNNPYGVWGDSLGVLYMTDTLNYRVRAITNNANLVYTVAGAGGDGSISSGNGGFATAALFKNPLYTSGDSLGNLYVTDYTSCEVRKLTPGFSVAPTPYPTYSTVAAPVYYSIVASAGNSTSSGFSGDNGPATNAKLSYPFQIWQDPNGDYYVADYGNRRVRKVSGGIISAFAGNGVASTSGDNGPATSASLNYPTGLWGGTNGKIYIAEMQGNAIRVVSSGFIAAFAGGSMSIVPTLANGDGGPATSASFASIQNLYGDKNGAIYVADTGNNKVRKIYLGQVTLLAGTGSPASTGDGGAATSATMYSPIGIFFDTSSVLYISDNGGFKIRAVSSNVMSTIVGTGYTGYNGDGMKGTSTYLASPYGVFCDSAGSVYIGDTGNGKVRMQSTSGNVYSIAGVGSSAVTSGNNGPATSAYFRTLMFISGDTVGNFMVGDYGSGEVRKLVYTAVPSTTPSFSPSTRPSILPTCAPSTTRPTVLPSVAPSSGPSLSPLSQVPTMKPTTSSPTCMPTMAPSIVPSFRPTTIPSISPIVNPTVIPTASPSNSPTFAPQPPSMIPTTASPTTPPVSAPVQYLVKLFAGTTNIGSYYGDGGPATSAAFNSPFGIFYSTAGVMYVSDYYNHRVRKVDSVGIISTFVGTGEASSTGDGSAASAATVNVPSGVWANSLGVTYVVERSGYKIRTIASNGIIDVYAGMGYSGYVGDGGQATSAFFSAVYDVVGDTAGNLFFSDSGNSVIRKIAVNGIITSVVGIAYGGSSAENVQATSAAIGTLTGVFVTALNSLYFTDAYNKIRFVASGSSTVITKAGTGTASFNGDGQDATSTSFNAPYDCYANTNGQVYVTDSGNSRVRLVTGSNIVYTVCGTGVDASTGNGGPSTAATVRQAYFLSGDTVGNFFFSEFSGQDVRSLINLTPTVMPTVMPSTVMPTTSFPSTVPISAPIGFSVTAYAGLSGTASSTGDGGPATSASINHPFGVWANSMGVLYICDYNGYRIRVVSVLGIISTLTGNGVAQSTGDGGAASSASVNVPSGVFGDTLGTIYLTERGGHKVRMISSSSIISTYAGTGVASSLSTDSNGDGGARTSATFNYPYGLFGKVGSLYVADSLNNKVRKVFGSTISTVAGTGGSGCTGEGCEGTSAALGTISAVFHMSLKLYIVDYGYSKVRSIASAQSTIFTVAGNGQLGFTGDGISATESALSSPLGVTGDTLGNVFIADTNNCRVRLVSSNIIYTIAGNGVSAASGDNNYATAATFKALYYVTADSIGNVFVGDYSASVVRRLIMMAPTSSPSIVPSSALPTTMPSIAPSQPTAVPTLAPTGTPSYQPVSPPGYYSVSAYMGSTYNSASLEDGVPATAACLVSPYSVWVSSSDTVYAADAFGYRVRYVNSFGIVKTLLGTGGSGDSGDGGAATSAQCGSPMGIWGDTNGKYFVSEYYGNRIRSVAADGIATTYAGTGFGGGSGDGGRATSANLYQPYSVFGDAYGTLYVADTYNNRVRKIGSDSIISTFAGTGGTGPGTEGIPTAIAVGSPVCIFVDQNSYVYILDLGSQQVRVIPYGLNYIQWVAGNPNGYAGDGAPATSTYFSYSYGMWMNTEGVMFIADNGHFTVRMVDAENIVYTIAGNGGTVSAGNGGPGLSAAFQAPLYVGGDSRGNVYVSDYRSSEVRILSLMIPSTMPSSMPVAAPTMYRISVLAGTSFVLGEDGDGGPAFEAFLNEPYGIWCDSIGSVYIANMASNKIRSVNSDLIINTVAGGGYVDDVGVRATAAILENPFGVFGNTVGEFYVTEFISTRVRKIDANQIITVLVGSYHGSTGDGGMASSALVDCPYGGFADTIGNIYIADTFNNKIRWINTANIINTIVGTGFGFSLGDGGPASSAGITNPVGVFVDSVGTLFVVESAAGFIRKVASGTLIISTIVGNGVVGYNGDGLAGTSASVNIINGLFGDTTGNLFFVDSNNFRVRMLSPSGIVYTIAGNGVSQSYGDNFLATAASFAEPMCVALDSTGILYVSDKASSEVRKMIPFSPTVAPTPHPSGRPVSVPTLLPTAIPSVAPSMSPSIVPTRTPTVIPSVSPTLVPVAAPVSFTISTYAGATSSGIATDYVEATAATLGQPCGMWQNTLGVLYVALATNSNKVRIIDSALIISTFAGVGDSFSLGDGGPASSASVYCPMGVHGDTNGNVYIVDNGAHNIRLVNSANIISLYAGSNSPSITSTLSNGDGGKATSATLRSPRYCFSDTVNNLYISDSGNYKVRKVDLLTDIISTVAGTGNYAFSGDGGTATSANFAALYGIFVNTDNNIYLADYDSHRFRCVQYSSSIVTTIIGSGLTIFNGEGLAATSSNFFNPRGVVQDTTGTIYLTDSGQRRVRILTDNLIYTIAGNGVFGYSGDGGMATSATFTQPNAILVQSSGSVLVSDYSTNVIRQLQLLAPSVVPTFVPSNAPSVLPSAGPTLDPSCFPSIDPSVMPSEGPSLIPSGAPTQYPSLLPSDSPSVFPSAVPSIQPSCAPVVATPSMLPSVLPSGCPSLQPTLKPSVCPTAIPSSLPIVSPSVLPTVRPSCVPTRAPSIAPSSALPSIQVSAPPTLIPSIVPSVMPTESPTVFPTSPTVKPTTAAPSVSRRPTVVPSRVPTAPTFTPTVGVAPTVYTIDMYAGVYGATSTIIVNNIAATSSTLYTPYGVWMDSTNCLFIADSSNNRVRKISASGIITTIVGAGGNLASGDGGPATSANTKAPYGVWSDSTGKVFVSEYGSSLIRTVSVTNIISKLAGTGTITSSPTAANGDGGAATAATLYYPFAIWGDSIGNVYIADSSNNKIRKITSSSIISTVVGTGGSTSSADGLALTSTTVYLPKSVFIDSLGGMYFMDSGAGKIRQVLASSSVVSTLAGTGISSYNADGISATATNLNSPWGVCMTNGGEMLVVEAVGFRIRMVASNNNMYVVAGTGVSSMTGDGGMASAAKLQYPQYITVGSDGRAFFSDKTANVVRVLEPVGWIPSTSTPSCSSTLMPTLLPTVINTGIPTRLPTLLSPTASTTTVTPSFSPTVAPTNRPSTVETGTPTTAPSQEPSMMPSVFPSVGPSAIPTLVPVMSLSPTLAPTEAPSDATVVTAVPSKIPSNLPSEFPTIVPSTVATFIPTVEPSVMPSRNPSCVPTIQPSISPVLVSPTHVPSVLPSVSPLQITTVPTVIPTTQSSSVRPSVGPTVSPSEAPSIAPTMPPFQSVKPTLGLAPGATLPGVSLSVIGYDRPFKIVLPFSETVLQSSSAFTDIDLTEGGVMGTNYVVMGGSNWAARVNLVDKAYGQVFSIDNALGSDAGGRSVSILKDFNADGYQDLIIGDPAASRCYVLFGSSAGFVNMQTGFTIFGELSTDLTGWSVSDAGDVNNDTIHDVIIGAPNAKGVGAFYVVYGKAAGMSDIRLNNLTNSIGFAAYGSIRGDKVGVSVSGAGDVNRDGCDDVIVGAMMASQYNSGTAFILYGAKSYTNFVVGSISASTGFKLVGDAFTLAGFSVSGAGDVNGDGFDDVLVGNSPQRSSYQIASYLIYGRSIGVNIQLSSLTALQGITLIGAGGVFSAGDINHDGLDDMLVTYASNSNAGYIVFSNISIGGFPSLAPSLIPTSAPEKFMPSVLPTRKPTEMPSFKPSRSPSTICPSFEPTTIPTAPSEAPTEGATMPSSHPSAVPTQPTIAPTEKPTIEPSEAPSESPTKEPTDSPSYKPSCEPSVLPSVVPTIHPTIKPTTVIPTVLIRPTRVPTLIPTAPTAAPSHSNYTVVHVTSGGYYQRSAVENFNFVINATSNTNITGRGGRARFTILPSPNTQLTIVSFNLSGDVIVLDAFTMLHSMDDLIIRKGSVIITLVNNQIVKLMNVNPTEMQPQHFEFSPYTGASDNNSMNTTVMYVVVPCGLILIAYALFKLYKWRSEKAAVNRTVREVKAKLKMQTETKDLKHSEQYQKLRKWHFERHERLLVVVYDEKLLSVLDYPEVEEGRGRSDEKLTLKDDEQTGSFHSSELNSLMDSIPGSSESGLFDSPIASPRNDLHKSLPEKKQKKAVPQSVSIVQHVNSDEESEGRSSKDSGSSSSSSSDGSSRGEKNVIGDVDDEADEDIDDVDDDDDLGSVVSDDWV